MNTNDKELGQLKSELTNLVGPNAAEQIFNDAVKKVQGETEAKVERKGYNPATLLGGLFGAAGVAITTRSVTAGVTGAVAAVAASYYTSETGREIQTLKDTGIGLASGATGAGAGFLGSKLLTQLLGKESESQPEETPVVTAEVEY